MFVDFRHCATYILIFMIYYCPKFHIPTFRNGASGAVGWDIAPQDGWFRVRLPLRSLEIFKLPIASVHIQWLWGPLSIQQKWVPTHFLGGKCGRRVSHYRSIMQNFKVGIKAQHPVSPLSVHDLLTGKFDFLNSEVHYLPPWNISKDANFILLSTPLPP